MNTAELLVKCLEAEGVEYVFGLPGEENADLMLAIDGSPIRFVLCRHEQAAAFMADAYGRLTGRAAVCLGTLGPGATNLVTGVANANMDRSPLVVITGQADSNRLHKESHQAMNIVDLFEPVTKWATSVLEPASIPEIVRKAFKLAEREKPGACHIELPEDIAAMATDASVMPRPDVRRPVPDDKIMDRAWELIRSAEKPVILAGNGAIRTRASRQLRRFVEATEIPVVCTFMGKGSIPRSSEQCLFTIGLQTRDAIMSVFDATDLVVALGYDLVEYHPRFWNPNGDKQIVHLDFLPAEVDSNYRVAVEATGDLAHALWMLNERCARDPVRFEFPEAKATREAMLADFAAHKDDDTEGRIKPQKALWDVRDLLGPDDILLSDVGAHKMWIARYYQCDEPNTCLIPNGFCSMGFALPGAIAAKLVYPDKRVLAICGDGGFLMNCQDMETAKRIGANIVVMVWEDGGYGLIEWKQETSYGRHTNLSFGNPDFIKLAEAFGWNGYYCDKSEELASTLEAAFAAESPSLVTIPIDYRENLGLTRRLGDIVCPI